MGLLFVANTTQLINIILLSGDLLNYKSFGMTEKKECEI